MGTLGPYSRPIKSNSPWLPDSISSPNFSALSLQTAPCWVQSAAAAGGTGVKDIDENIFSPAGVAAVGCTSITLRH